MPRGKLTPEGRRRLAEAQRRRWARYRAEKANGISMGMSPRPARRGRPRRSNTSGANPFLSMTVSELVSAKQQLDEAWNMASRLLRRG